MMLGSAACRDCCLLALGAAAPLPALRRRRSTRPRRRARSASGSTAISAWSTPTRRARCARWSTRSTPSAGRKYEQIAEKQGAPLAAVAQIAGKKLIERTPAGQYVLDADGQWRQK